MRGEKNYYLLCKDLKYRLREREREIVRVLTIHLIYFES